MRAIFLVLNSLANFRRACLRLGAAKGHQIVALIARAHLTPAASAGVDRLLEPIPWIPR